MSKTMLIIGGGLAGTFLAASFCKNGHQVILIDDNDPNAATRVAGGMFNVVTGRLAHLTWMSDELLEAMKSFFEHPDFAHLKPLLHLQKIFRPFKTVQEHSEWAAQTMLPQFRDITEISPDPYMEDQIHNPWGGLWITPCGWAETGNIVAGIKQVLADKYEFEWLQGDIEYEAIQLNNKKVSFAETTYGFDHVFYAEGVRAKTNPLFSFMDLRPLKGQVLEVEIPGFDPDFILSKKVFLINKGDNRFVCGATYEREFDHPNPTPHGKEELMGNLMMAIKLPFTVLRTIAGVRPTSPNRRPICGTHPDFDFVHVFNGLGTKGWLQAPYFAAHFAQHFDQKEGLIIKGISLSRFIKEN